MTKKRSKAPNVETMKRQKRAVELHMAGLDYRDIAAQMRTEGFGEKYSLATVSRDIKYAKEQAQTELKETAVDALTLEFMRLEQLHRVWWLPAVGLTPADPESTPDAQAAKNFFVNIPNPPTPAVDPNAPPMPVPPTKMAKPDPAAARVVLAAMGHRLKLVEQFARLAPPSTASSDTGDPQKAINSMSEEEVDAVIRNLTGG